MKIALILLLLCTLLTFATAQSRYVDSLRNTLTITRNDTSKVLLFNALARYYAFNQTDSGFFYAQKAIELSQQLHYTYGEAMGFVNLGWALAHAGNYPKAQEMTFRGVELAKQIKYRRPFIMFRAYITMGFINHIMKNFTHAISFYRQAINIQLESGIPDSNIFIPYSQIAYTYSDMNKLDSALFYAKKGYQAALLSKTDLRSIPYSIYDLGYTYLKVGNYRLAEHYYKQADQIAGYFEDHNLEAQDYNGLASVFYQLGQKDSCIYWAQKSLQLSDQFDFAEWALNASSTLVDLYESQHQADSTLKYMKIMLAAKDSVFGQARVEQFQLLQFDEQQRQLAIITAEKQYLNQFRLYILLAILGVMLLLGVILLRNNRRKIKDNALLQRKNEEMQNTLTELKSAQTQLIQSEKMASLGELTAGIAHEIQNPLNFVNNFSEVNTELLSEMVRDIHEGNTAVALETAAGISGNMEKITYHGKRADTIVKSMLQHSGISTGQKEPTDINALADEYLRLSYHGFRAKDKSFNAALHTDFDPSAGQINIVPQDIGRALLNLFNNAFYALAEHKKQHGDSYSPELSIIIRKSNNGIEIKVRDNGPGIPTLILDKIFQPFFTTKSPGQGTGLGLSLCYDIITKEHGGQIRAESREGEYSEFIIWLPGGGT